MNWKKITEKIKIDEIVKSSKEQPALILKHSPRCAISNTAYGRFDDYENDSYEYYIIDVLKNRDVSQYLAQLSNVTHQSPQLLLLKDGKIQSYWSQLDVSPQNL